MTAFYNEYNPYVAQYLRNLIAAGLIAPGVVDSRDIQDIEAWELSGFTQVHMFAGIGIWSGALRAAGWPDDESIWTGSCPCQPFSNAGLKKGISDDRHLFPYWRDLIAQCRPPRIAGEQVASKDGKIWLDIVSTDLEALGFAFGAADLCAAGFGGAHIRQREYFVGLADAIGERLERCNSGWGFRQGNKGGAFERSNAIDGMGNAMLDGNGTISGNNDQPEKEIVRVDGHSSGTSIAGEPTGSISGLAVAAQQFRNRTGNLGTARRLEHSDSSRGANPALCDSGKIDRRWLDADWLLCRNPAGKPSWRPVEPGTFPLAHGIPDRMGKLRAYGNALDFETAKGFCEILVEICLGV